METLTAPAKPAAAPTPSPNATQAPAPKPDAAPKSESAAPPIEEDDFRSDLQKLAGGGDQDEEAPITDEKEKPAAPEKPATPPEKPAVDPGEPKSAGELRKAYSSIKTERDTLKKQLEEVSKKSSTDNPETKALIEEATRSKTRLQELETEIKHLKYERSTEYKDNYEKPMEKALSSAFKEVSQMTVTTDEGDRPATNEDFNAILRAPLQQASTLAHSMFGPAASEVLAFRREILKMNQARQEAIEEYKTKGAAQEQEQTAHQAAESQRLRGLWEKESKGVVEKYAVLFAPEEGDDEGNQALEQGFKLADLAFHGDLPPEQALRVRADVRARAAGFGRAVIRAKRFQDKIKVLEERLKAFESSDPGTGGHPGTKEAPDELDFEAGIRKLAGA